MSVDPPKGPEDGSPPDDPSDLASVEGLAVREPDPNPDPDTEPIPSAVVELPRLTAAEGDDDDEPDPHADPDGHTDLYDVHSLPRGTQLGRYVLLGRVRDHEDEVIYGAYDPASDRKVSLKLFNPGDDGDDAATRRLLMARQAQAVAKLSHPCVEQILETGVYGPWVFLATEFIDGIDLRHWMEARDDPFPWPEVLRVFREAGRGLAAAHAQGIVHHDFKPSNVIMGKEGRLVVVDFGLAAQIEEEEDDVLISQLRESMEGPESTEDEDQRPASGTPAYMAPEKHLTGHGDARSDQFSFCVSLYEALYGERPFSGNRPRAVALEAAKHKVRPAPEGSTVPAWLRAVVLRGLSPRPDDRYPSMEALLRELARDPAASRRRWGWGAAIVGALGVGVGLFAVQLERDRSACEDAGEDSALAAVWSAARREDLHEAFTATGRGWADPTWRYTETKLDAWADEWRDLSERACLATRVWENSSEYDYLLRLACLDRHLAGFDATLEVLATVDGPMLDRAHVLADDLPLPRQCTDTETLATLGLPPEPQRDEVETLQRALAGLETRLVLSGPGPVLTELPALQTRAEAVADPALIARGQLLQGRAQHAAGDPRAEATLHRAATTALRAGHQRLAAQGWMARMDALVGPGRADEAAALGDYVEALVERKNFAWLWSRLEVARGDAEWRRGRPAEALARYHEATQHEEIRADVDRLRLLPAWLGQADVLVARNELDDAHAQLQAALEAVRNALGPHHPAAVAVLQRLGTVERQRGRPAEARAHLEQALELVRNGTDDPARRAELEGHVGTLLAAEGEMERARPHLEEAYHALGGAAAATRPEVFRLGLAVAHAQQASGDSATAREVLEAILAPFRQQPLPTGSAEATQPTTADRAEAEVLLATLVWEGGEPARARALATSTLDRLDDSPAHEVYRAEVERWLEEHRLEERRSP